MRSLQEKIVKHLRSVVTENTYSAGQIDQFYRKNINTIFPDITPDKLPVPEEKEISEISTQVGDCIYRISMQRVLLGEAMVHSEVLEGLSENTSLIAMYLYDETELKDYIKAIRRERLTSSTLSSASS